MVKDALDRGQTYTQLAERAIDPLTAQRASLALLNDIGRGKVGRMPYDYHLRAIAAALGKPYEVVRQAAIAQWLPEQASDQAATPSPSALLEQAERLAAQVVETAKEARRQLAEEERPGERETA
jgi:cell division septum initiation protein DivIVA